MSIRGSDGHCPCAIAQRRKLRSLPLGEIVKGELRGLTRPRPSARGVFTTAAVTASVLPQMECSTEAGVSKGFHAVDIFGIASSDHIRDPLRINDAAVRFVYPLG